MSYCLACLREAGHVMVRRAYSEKDFHTLFEAAPNGVLAIDAGGCIALVNAQAEKMFGYNRAEILGKPVEVLVPQRFRRRHADLRKKAAANPRIRPMGKASTLPS